MAANTGSAQSWLARRATAYSITNRTRKAAMIREFIAVNDVRSVLLIGTEDATYPWSNIVEQSLIESDVRVVATGLGPTIDVPTERAIADGRKLPFRDKTFDLAISNAVIEHVGDRSDQHAFASEHHRVASHFILTTPNLLFPVESHRRVAIRHWSPTWRAANGEHFTRLLTPRTLAELLPRRGTTVKGSWLAPTLVATHSCSRGGCS